VTPQEEQLLCKYLDGRLTEEDKDRLQDVLRNSAEARKKLRMLATVTEGLSGQEAVPELTHVSRNNALIPWGIAAAATIMAIIAWVDTPLPAPHSPATSDSFLALLVNEAGAEFSDANAPDGIRFKQGRHELNQGSIHLRFANGADVVLKAPALFEINDGFHMRLHHGKIWAMAPPGAQGFTVATPGVDYEDLGTEFAISVDRDTGASQLHVLDGQVDVKHPDSKKLLSSVTGGQSLEFAEGKATQIDTPDLKSYPRPNSIGLLRWEQQRAEWGGKDKDLIAYYPFVKSEALKNEALNSSSSDGEIHGARWVTGRWSGKHALLFDRDTDFVELDISGEYEEMTFSAWVKLDRLEHNHSSVFNSNGWDMGDVHWTIHRPGIMAIGAKGFMAPKGSLGTRLKMIPTDQWVHIAASLSSESGESCLYLNGELAGTRELTPEELIRPGLGRIGNWFKGDRKDGAPMRAMRGKMDELAVWKRALTQDEIKQQVESGKPNTLWSIASN